MILKKENSDTHDNESTLHRLAKNGWVQLTAKALGITLLAFVLSKCLTAPFSASTNAIFSSPEKSDFILPDLFAQVADNRPVRQYDDRITVIDIKDAGREEIAGTLETLSLCGPAAIGLDVNFADAREDDSRLLEAISLHPGIVLPLGVEQVQATSSEKSSSDSKRDDETFRISDSPFFYGNLQGVCYGIVNFPTKNAKATIREVPVTFRMENGERFPSFVEALAMKTDPAAAKNSMESGNWTKNIAFHSREFTVIPYEEIDDRAEELAGKIVLIGSCTDASDMHPTPTMDSMPGIMVHAHALATMLDGNWLKPMPEYMDGVIAALICFIIVLATIGIRSGTRGLVIRILQVASAYLAVRIGYEMYVEHNIICNLSHTLLMIAFGLFAVDIWNGCVALGDIAMKRIKRIRNSSKNNLTCEKSF